MSRKFFLYRDEDLIIVGKSLETIVKKIVYDCKLKLNKGELSEFAFEDRMCFLNKAANYDYEIPDTDNLCYDNDIKKHCHECELVSIPRAYPLNRTKENLLAYYNKFCMGGSRSHEPKSLFKVTASDLGEQYNFTDSSERKTFPTKAFKKDNAGLVARVISKYLNARAKDDESPLDIESYRETRVLVNTVCHNILAHSEKETYQEIVNRLYRDFEVRQSLYYTFASIADNGEVFDNYASFKLGKHTDNLTVLELEGEFLKLFLEFSTGKVDETLLCIRTYIEEQLFEK